MHPLAKTFLRLGIALVAIFFAIQPYNWYCQITNQCQPFLLSYYIPREVGNDPFNITFEVTNYHKDIIFSPSAKEIKQALAGKKYEVFYHAENLTKKAIYLSPKLIIEPAYAEQYLIRYQCLCSRRYKLDPKEKIDLRMEFTFDKKIEEDKKFSNTPEQERSIKIRFKI